MVQPGGLQVAGTDRNYASCRVDVSANATTEEVCQAQIDLMDDGDD